jgi:hypothetical protein
VNPEDKAAELRRALRPGRVVKDDQGRSTTVLSPYEPCEVCRTLIVGLDHRTQGRCVAEVRAVFRNLTRGGLWVGFRHHTPTRCRTLKRTVG